MLEAILMETGRFSEKPSAKQVARIPNDLAANASISRWAEECRGYYRIARVSNAVACGTVPVR